MFHPKVNADLKSSISKMFEYVSALILFFLVIDLLTRQGINDKRFVIVLIIIIALTALYFYHHNKGSVLWFYLAGMTFGFFLFSLFRYKGWVSWPMHKAESIKNYTFLFCSHLAFVGCIASGLLIHWIVISRKIHLTEMQGLFKISWHGRYGILRDILSLIVCLGIWFWVIWHVMNTQLDATGPLVGFLLLAIGKAVINSAAEEYCYRGLLLNAAIKRYGIYAGVIMSALFYMVFHIHLGVALTSGRLLFLFSVFVLGVVFAIWTRYTGGILWAFIVHAGIDLVIEWNNIS